MSARTFSSLCGNLSGSPPPAGGYAHVIWIWLENHSYEQIIGPPGSKVAARAPYTNGTLVPGCGLAMNYHGLSHPSLPNYLGATSGDTYAISRNCLPAACPSSAPSLFGELAAAGKTWRTYAEGMLGPCDRTTGSLTYEPPHNAAVYYADAAAACPSWDVQFDDPSVGFLADLRNHSLPDFSFVVPDECHNTSTCSITTGDSWLQAWIPQIAASASYQAGGTVVFVTWDEGQTKSRLHGEVCSANPTDPSCHVTMLVISPYTAPGTQSNTLFNHYSLLRTTEDLLGLTHLAHADDPSTASLAPDFGLLAP